MEAKKVKNIRKRQIGIFLMITGVLIIGTQTGYAVQQNQLTLPVETTGWLYVGGGGPGNYTSIQNAIDAASNLDTIYVFAETYSENLIIDKSITLIGEDKNLTTITGDNVQTTIEVTGEKVTIQGFTITNDGSQDGIYTSTSLHNFVDNIITLTSYGIYLHYSSENLVTGNLFYNNTISGVYIEVGQNNSLMENTFYNNTEEGIYLTGCGASHVENNTIFQNGKGIHAYSANGLIIRNNDIEANSYGIHFSGVITVHSNFNTISHNMISNNTNVGIRIENSQFNVIEYNKIFGNGKGVQFEMTGANTIRYNNITSSMMTEIELTFSLGDLIISNNIDNSQQSLVLAQVTIGFVMAPSNWWGSAQWPIRRIRPLGGWITVMPWKTNSYDFSVGPE